MRAPLRVQDANARAHSPNVALTANASAVTQHGGSGTAVAAGGLEQQPEEERDSLREWRRRWRRIMADAVAFFENIPQTQVDSLRSHLAVLGTQSQPFYDQRVSHYITNNPESTGAVRARERGLKVYTVDKLTRFLTALLGYQPVTALDAAQSAKLAQMLEEDTRMSAHAATYARKDDFHYLRGPYLLVWDPTQYNRPLCIKEWRAAGEHEDGEWPQLRRVPVGMCPFVPRSVTRSEKRRPHHQVVSQSQGPAAAPLANGAINQITNTGAAGASLKKRRALSGIAEEGASRNTNDNDLNDEDDKENRVPSQSRTTPRPAQATNSTRLREFGEIVASGMQRYSQQSAKSMSLPGEGASSREMANLRRKVLPRPAQPSQQYLSNTSASGPTNGATLMTTASPTAPAMTAGNGTASPDTALSASQLTSVSRASATSQPAAAQVHAHHVPGNKAASVASVSHRPVAKPKTASKKPGFCENCLEKYDDLTEHLLSRTHTKFAANERKFASLDEVIGELRRPVP